MNAPVNRQGFALITVMLVVVIVGLLATAAAVVGSANILSNRYYERQSLLNDLALEGIELARARVNGNKSLYPTQGYNALESDAPVVDGNGDTIPGVRRSTYVGPTGSTSGQYGIFGSIVTVVKDAGGGVVVRRGQVFQESFAKFAYFTDVEPYYISFGGGDQIFGPVHTNDFLKIYSSGATFHDEVVTAKTVKGAQYGTFDKGYEENGAYINMPETTELTKLQAQAATGSASFTAGSPSGSGEAYMRIEFIAIDLDGDGSVTGENEGFFRVYKSTDARWVSGDIPTNGMRYSRNCGHYHGGTFVSAADHPNSGNDSWVASLSNNTKRCYLGGADSLFGGFQATDSKGSWVAWTGSVSPLLSGRPDAQYLFPLSREMNPDFKGVIYVDGKVVVSGVLRGRVTLAATQEIIIGDDITYASDPGLGTCADMLGLFSGNDVVVANNTLNTPTRPWYGQNYFTYDDTKDEFIHGIILALNIFTVEDYASGDRRAEKCEGKLWGRGCLYLTGGIIQKTRGAVGTISWVGGTGYVKRYSYDRCGATAPPPYFPTTGHFSRGQTYWVEPTGFSVASYFDMLTS
ncbi:MAG: type II secretion system protein [Gemmatimonadota bacterium]